MKKYEKPRIYIERFELSQHIAACAWDMNSQNPEHCTTTPDPSFGYPEGINQFLESNVNCDVHVGLEDFCYTTGDGKINIFNS